MFRRSFVTCVSLASAAWLATAADAPPQQAKLSAAEIVEKNVAARGGLQAWRGVQTMSLTGKLGAGGNQRGTLQGAATSTKGNLRAAISQRPVEETYLPF